MMWPSAAVIVSSGPDRRGALRDARQDLDAVEAHADRAAVDAPRRRRTAPSSSSGVRAGGEPAEQRHHRRRLGQEAQHGVGGERERVGEQDRARGARRGRACPISAPAPSSSSSTSRGTAVASPPPSAAAHTDTAVPVLDLARVADHAAGAAADSSSGVEHLVDGLERRLGRGEVRAGGEHDREVAGAPAEPARAVDGRLERADARVGRGREAGADADAHCD